MGDQSTSGGLLDLGQLIKGVIREALIVLALQSAGFVVVEARQIARTVLVQDARELAWTVARAAVAVVAADDPDAGGGRAGRRLLKPTLQVLEGVVAEPEAPARGRQT